MSESDPDKLALLDRFLSEMLADVRLDKDEAFEAYHEEMDAALKQAGFEVSLPREITLLQRTLRNEQDRGCALAGVAFLDFAVTEMLKAHMVEDEASLDELFRPSGPLGSFAVRITLSFVLGLVPRDAAREMNLMRKIRNDFAHSAEPITFDAPAIADRCRQLNFVIVDDGLSPRRRFVRALLGVLGAVHGQTRGARRPDRRSDLSPELTKKDERVAAILRVADDLAAKRRSPN